MLIEFACRWAIDLENAPRLARTFDQDIGRRDNPVLRIERRRRKALVSRKVFDDHGLARHKCSTLCRLLIRLRYNAPDYTCMPANPRFDEEVLLSCAVAANLSVRNAQALRTNARGFGQDLLQVWLPESEAAKVRKRSLLTQELLNRARFAHVGAA
jgi:hypothetical protein